MPAERDRFGENRAAGLALRWGLRASAAVMAAGVALDAAGRDGSGLALLGVALLLATPFARALSLAAVFARGRHWRLFACAAAVLALLAFAFALGRL
ncbi:MAG: DUF1634 domain-containing protein [Elusimicrobia bacterium]|nr:DUF1634 domain-containing protein [Elusimicrobiota bacterium]